MKNHIKEKYRNLVFEACQRERKSADTVKCYTGWALRFIQFVDDVPRTKAIAMSSEEKVSAFLELQSSKAAATQDQALNALVFFYRAAIQNPLGDLPCWTKAKKPFRIPVWLSPEQCVHLFRFMHDPYRLIAQLMFGSGSRLNETLALRIQDIDFSARTVRIRAGKGDKWRVTCLPEALLVSLREQVEYCRDLWEQDRRGRVNPVKLPDGLERKFPKGGEEFEWFWLFPARNLARCTGYRDRWHVHEDTFSKQLKNARRRAGMGARVTAHILRHSFATACVQNGMPIHELQKLMGHADIKTTAIYLHCRPLLATDSVSPLDAAAASSQENVVPFVSLEDAPPVPRIVNRG